MMSLRTLGEPISMVSRYRPTPSPPRVQPSQASRRLMNNSSKVLAALEMGIGVNASNEQCVDDDSIEIDGPFPVPPKSRATSRMKESAQPAHPLFNKEDNLMLLEQAVRKPPSVRAKTPQVLLDTASTEGASTSAIDTSKAKPKIGAASKTASLPVYSYKDYSPVPSTVYTQNEDEANDLVEALNGPLGFDLEWRVIWHRGAAERRTALVQLCDERMILLIQVSSMKKFPQKLKEIIESSEIIKLGANIHNDGAKLFRDFGIRAKNLVELGALGRHVDPAFAQIHKRYVVSLANVVGHYAGKSLMKGKERTGNWEALLNEKMIEYAANDAHCALVVYKKVISVAADNEVTLTPSAYTSNVDGPPAARIEKSASISSDKDVSTSDLVAKSTANDATASGAISERPSPQYLRAYKMWHHQKKSLTTMCKELTTRGEPLKESTVISYVVKALQLDAQLTFDMDQLKELVQMEASSWQRHRQWIATTMTEGRGVC